MNNTRQRIIESAIEIFAENGFNEGGLREITERAGVVRPSLYHYFGSRDGLWREVYEFLLREYVNFVRKNFVPEKDLEKNIQRMIKVQQKFNAKYPQRLRVLFQSALTRPQKELITIRNQIQPVCREMIEQAFTACGVTASDDVTDILQVFIESNLMSLALGKKSTRDFDTVDKMASMFAAMIKESSSEGHNGRKKGSLNGKKMIQAVR